MILQSLIFGAKSMEEDVKLQDYNILPSSTIIFEHEASGRITSTKKFKGCRGSVRIYYSQRNKIESREI